MKTFLHTCLSVAITTLIMPNFTFADDSQTHFERWVTKRTEELDNAGKTYNSGTSTIQYEWKGDKKHPVILSFHGAYGGWDQSLLIASSFLEHGFSVLAISRPGYLGSTLGGPLPPGITPEAQADAIVGLLNYLNISQVASLGFSAGAPVAYLLAQRHPTRVWALVLESIGANVPQDVPLYSTLEALMTLGDPTLVDFQTYMMTIASEEEFESIGKEIFTYDSNLSDNQLNERIEYVKSHHEQAKFLKKLILAAAPLSPRSLGGENDIATIEQFSLLPYSGFSTPTTIVQSINDTNGNFATAEFVNDQINAQQAGLSTLLKVHGSGHFVWLGEHTKDWEKKVTQFLRLYKP